MENETKKRIGRKAGPFGPHKNSKDKFCIGFERIPMTKRMTPEPKAALGQSENKIICPRVALEQIGIKVICVDPDDDMFYRCKIPRGWTITDGNILDENMKVRVRIAVNFNKGVCRSEANVPYFIIED